MAITVIGINKVTAEQRRSVELLISGGYLPDEATASIAIV
jgi:hypothetical protein